MLQAIRTRAGSLLVKLLFGFLILTFSLWGIGDIFRDRSQDTTVATVGNRTIHVEEVQTAMQRALARIRQQTGQSVDLQQAKQLGLVDRVVEQLVTDSLLAQEARRLDLDLADDVIRNAIFSNPAFAGPDGRFERGLFDQTLAENGLSEPQYVAELRRGMPGAQVSQAVSDAAQVPQSVIDTVYRWREQKRVAELVGLPFDKAPDPGQPSAEALQKFYDAHKQLFAAPEYRKVTLASLTPADLAATIKVTPEKLQEAYKDSADDLQVPEKRQVEQILAPSEEKAKAAMAALAAGRDWKEVATTVAGQKSDTIDLGLLEEDQLPGTLGKAAFSLPLNKPSQPIKTPLGWHILRVVKIAPATTQSFEQAKPQLLAKLTHDAALDRIYEIGNQVDDALAGGASLDAAAGKYGLKLTRIAAVDDKGNGPDGKPVSLPIAPQGVVKLALDTEEEHTSRVVDTEDSGIYVVRVDGVISAHVRPLTEVKDKAVAAWQTEERRKAVEAQATALQKAVTPGTRLAAVASGKGLKSSMTPPLSRQAEAGGPLPASVVAQVFAAKPDAVVVGNDEKGFYVAQLDKVETPQSPTAAETADLKEQLAQAVRSDLEAEFTDALKQRFPVAIHGDTLAKAF